MKKYLLLTLLTLAIISCEEEIPVYTVTVSSSPSEGGSVSPQGGEYEQGQTASFTATPNEFYGFAGWSGADTSTINPISIIVDTNKSLTARFEKLDTDNDGITDDIDQCPDTPANEQADSNGCSVSQKDFELTVSVEGEGTVTEEVVVAPTIYQGTTQVQLTAVPAEGWEFTEWTGNATGPDNPITIEIDGTKNITAVFTKKDTDGDGVPDLEDTCADTPSGEEADENGCSLSQKDFELAITVEGEGSVTEELIVAPSMYKGTSEVKLTAVPAEGWEFTEWTGDVTGTENPVTIEIDGAKSVTVVFTKKDTDGDGVPDLEDVCADTPDGEEVDENGCSASQRDSDNDGVNDDSDLCPDTPEGSTVNANGCHDVIYIDDNGVTVKARETAIIGDTQVINNKTYKVVDEAMLRAMVANDEDVTTVVTTRVTNMANLFSGKETFNQNISSWDTSSVTNMLGMFSVGVLTDDNEMVFNQDISKWDVSKVTDMSSMFVRARSFNQDIGNWNVSSVINMSGMFLQAIRFNQDISNWDMSNVVTINTMFQDAWSFNQDISNWNVSNVTDMEAVFNQALVFNQDINHWDVSKVTRMRSMFANTREFNQDLNSWDTSSVTHMSNMFRDAKAFNGNISSWDVSNVTDFNSTFMGAIVFNSDISDWKTTSAETMSSMFANTRAFNGDISSWDVSSVSNMLQMFGNADGFNIDIGDWNVSNVTNMDYMFRFADVFNQDISAWCVSNFDEEPTSFKSGSPLTDANSPVWGTCPINTSLVTAVKTGTGTSQSCTNGVCTTNYTLVTKIQNNSGQTITLTKIEIYFGSTYANSTTEQNGDIQDGGSKSVSWTYPSTNLNSGRPLVKFYWTYEGVEYITEYQD